MARAEACKYGSDTPLHTCPKERSWMHHAPPPVSLSSFSQAFYSPNPLRRSPSSSPSSNLSNAAPFPQFHPFLPIWRICAADSHVHSCISFTEGYKLLVGVSWVFKRKLRSGIKSYRGGELFHARVGRPTMLAFTRVVCAQQQSSLKFVNPLNLRQARNVSLNTRVHHPWLWTLIVKRSASERRQQGSGRRDGLLYIPSSYSVEKPAPVALILHGAGGHAQGALQLIKDYAEGHNLILIAPESRGRTWDMIIDAYGPDVEFIDRCLAKVFQEYTVDPTHLAIAGFSDGASYSISLGVCNGFLFTHIIGFSPDKLLHKL